MPRIEGVLFDAVRLTADSESNPRDQGIEQIDTLQIHHATTKSLPGLESLMAPGGRTVSATAALGSDGTLVYKVDLRRRPYTSASQTDERSFTVECCNTSYAPDWGISDAEHERLAVLLLDLHDRFGVPLKRGLPGVIGHNEVPGTYPTACPGPSMNLDRIVARAKELKEEREMPTAQEIAKAVWSYPIKNLINTRRAKKTSTSTAASILGAAHEDGYDAVNGGVIAAQVKAALLDPNTLAALKVGLGLDKSAPDEPPVS